MEENINPWEEQTTALAEPQPEYLAPRPPRAPRRAKKNAPWRMAALILCGILCYAAIIIAAALVWGSLTYMRQGEAQTAVTLPLVIFLAAVFGSASLVTLFSRGGTIFPALTVAVAVNIIPFFFQTPAPSLPGLLLKLLLALLAAIFGFSLSKLWYIKHRH